MRVAHIIGLLGFSAGLLVCGCAGKDKGGGNGNSAGNGNAAGAAAGTGASLEPTFGGNGGANGTGIVTPTGQVAQDTPDGLTAITSTQAAKLTDAAVMCSGWSSEPEDASTPPILEFAIDVTGSMADQPAYPAEANSPSKWTEMQRVLPSVFQSFKTDWVTGVSYFRKPDNGCFVPDQSVPIDVLTAAQLTAIEGSIARRGPKGNTNAADNVQGATPTYAAWKHALEQLTTYQAPAGYETSKRYIVLITDGVPTVNADGCTYVNPITQTEYDSEIALIKSEGDKAGVKTFVVGVLGSEQAQNATYDPLYMLSNIAVAGGTAKPAGCVPTSGSLDANHTTLETHGSYCHYDLSQSQDFAGDLTTALSDIQGSIISCKYAIGTPPAGKTIDPNKTVIVYNDGSGNTSVVLPNTSGTCDKGWAFTDSTNSNLEICGGTCALLQANPKANLTLIFGCGIGDVLTLQ